MGIGRREFFRLFSMGIAAATNPNAAIAIFDDHYVNRRLGIAFEKPRGWMFANVQQMADVAAGQILDLNNPELSRLIVETVELPILTISRESLSASSDHFTPGVTVYLDRITPEDCPETHFLSTIETLEADCRSCSSMLKDFRVIAGAKSTTVSACAAAQYVASFTFEHTNMEPTPVRMKTLVIDQGTAFYTLRMYDSPTRSETMAFDYTDFTASIRIV